MVLAKIPRRAVCLGLAVAALGCKRTVTIEVSRDEIQQRLAARFPLQKPLLLGSVSFENPNVVLREGSDRIGVELDIKLQMPLVPTQSGKLALSGKPEYRPAEKAFYLTQAAVDRFEVAGLPAAESEKLRAPVELVARPVLDTFAVYQFEQRNWKEVGAEHVLKAVRVENGKLLATLGP